MPNFCQEVPAEMFSVSKHTVGALFPKVLASATFWFEKKHSWISQVGTDYKQTQNSGNYPFYQSFL